MYLHFLDGSRVHRGSVIVIAENETPPIVEHSIGGSPLMGGKTKELYDARWMLGSVDETEANRLALALAELYGCDVIANGKLLGLPYLGDTGKWISVSEAAAALGRRGGSVTSEAKTAAARENAKKGGWPKGKPRKAKETTDSKPNIS